RFRRLGMVLRIIEQLVQECRSDGDLDLGAFRFGNQPHAVRHPRDVLKVVRRIGAMRPLASDYPQAIEKSLVPGAHTQTSSMSPSRAGMSSIAWPPRSLSRRRARSASASTVSSE